MTYIILISIIVVFFLVRGPKRGGGSILWRRESAKQIGDRGEAAVAWRLDKLSDEYAVFNDVLLVLGNYSTQIDHVVISPYGIFVIETKNIHGKVYGSDSAEYWRQYLPQRLYRYFGNQEFTFRNPVWQNTGHVKALRRLLSDQNVPIFGIVAFSNETDLRVSSSYPVMYMWDVVPFIESKKDVSLSESEVAMISNKIAYYNHLGQEARETHLMIVQENKRRRDERVAFGCCPLCGGTLVLRNGRYGSFYGCSNYPTCTYRRKIDS